jgi:hypothetical protein
MPMEHEKFNEEELAIIRRFLDARVAFWEYEAMLAAGHDAADMAKDFAAKGRWSASERDFYLDKYHKADEKPRKKAKKGK